MLKYFKTFPRLYLNYHLLILLSSAFIVFCLNHFFNTTFNTTAHQVGFDYLVWLNGVIHILILALAFEIISLRLSVKYVIGIVLLLCSVCGFYMDSLGVAFDEDIIQSIFETHIDEAFDLMSFGLIKYILLFGVFPIVLLTFIKLKKKPFVRAFTQKIVFIIILSMLIGGSYGLWGKDIVFVFKAQKKLEKILNPIAPIRSLFLYIQHSQEKQSFVPTLIAKDATLAKEIPPQIVVFVIGESARSANFALNGYVKPTNPYTNTLNVISFKEFYSCGVITAISVPCMLTNYTQETYTNRNLSLYINNILDIAQSVGYEVWYLGNNGGKCVGGCDRNIKHTIIYPTDSLDSVMLPDIKNIIANAHKMRQNTFIVVHQYGSHGASYSKRYPPDWTRFTPVCEEKELSKCTYEEIINAYDNSLVYSDWILAQMIENLQKVDDMRSMLWYVSDHGESLGELGQYMHGGLGYTLAPKYQKHIPSIMWFSTGWENAPAKARERINHHLSHDYVFHTLLHILGIHTQDYQQALDIMP
ncbi:phosphoethanolamine transferase [Helicobacter sp. MIT 03-1614]|uniref:phosphoethanolamine transferase n=1 Tax=Helicobacter sp. MIT 03-1614 TaxID=1548147 RepID=UPI000512DE08|nr:sulfatase-like hydrolase/transferase [Helicobacter sp. MIT 03-1614]TLD88501.1 phosphoethanolamine transferase [Helicobacter sp. MIT 03-1614]